MIEEIRRLHRMEQPNLYQFLERYSAARTALIGVGKLSPALSDDMQTQIQSAITTLTTIENVVERARIERISPDFAELNQLLSVEIDKLHEILIDMTTTNEDRV